MATGEKEAYEMKKSMQESWLTVEAGGETETAQPKSLSHVKSEEEITQLLAEAVNEEKERKGPVIVLDQRKTEGKATTISVYEGTQSENGTGTTNIEQSYLKSFLSTLFTPSFILSHLTVFLIGILVGRKLM